VSLSNLIGSLYLASVQSDNVRYRQFPAAGAGVAIADDAAWDEITASAASPTVNFWLAGLNISLPTAGITADTEEVLAVGSGGADGATVAAAVLLVEHEILATIDTAVGEYLVPVAYLPVPIRVLATSRIAARISSSITGGMALSGLGYSVITGLGT
jgi:hypothetical protein